MTAAKHDTREAWLVAAVKALHSIFEDIGETVPSVRVSVGWPGGRGKKSSVVGQCWATTSASDGVSNLFVSPVLDDSVRVLDVLTHELVHAVDDCEHGHRGRFARIARSIGLEGKMTATVAGDALRERLEGIAGVLGAYPHAAMVVGSGPTKQTTRMLKLQAPCCGYVVRTTARWIETGLPSCPCGEEMELA